MNADTDKDKKSHPRETIGAVLSRERISRGLELDDISQQTRIKRTYLEAIERDDYRLLPSGPFLRGFVNSYAKVLGLDGEKLSPLIPEIEPPALTDPMIAADSSRHDPPLEIRDLPVGSREASGAAWLIAGGVVLALAAAGVFLYPMVRDWSGFGAWHPFGSAVRQPIDEPVAIVPSPAATIDSTKATSEEAPAPAQGTAPPPPQSPVEVVAAAASPAPVESLGEAIPGSSSIRRLASIEAEDELVYQVYADASMTSSQSHSVEVTAVRRSYVRQSTTLGAKPVLDRVLSPGESLVFTDPGDIWLVIGNGGGVTLTYNGTSLQSPGKVGEKVGVAFRRVDSR